MGISFSFFFRPVDLAAHGLFGICVIFCILVLNYRNFFISLVEANGKLTMKLNFRHRKALLPLPRGVQDT